MKGRALWLAAASTVAGAAAFYFLVADAPETAGVPASSHAPAVPAPAKVPAVVPPKTTEQGAVAGSPTDDAATLDRIGRAQLAQGIEALKDKRGDARSLLESAAKALGKAIELSGDRVDPWTLASMAQAQVELGNDIDAVAWADRALQQLRQGSNDDYTQFRAAQLTMSVGIVYYRAGQKPTGIAYMDQAISMAPTEFDRADFSDLKDETIGG